MLPLPMGNTDRRQEGRKKEKEGEVEEGKSHSLFVSGGALSDSTYQGLSRGLFSSVSDRVMLIAVHGSDSGDIRRSLL